MQQIELFTHQMEYMQSEATHTALVGGFGSGKSFAGISKTVEMKLAMPNITVAYYLPTYRLIKDMAFDKFKEYLDLRNIPYKLHETDKEFDTPFGKIVLRSMSDPNLIVAYETGYACIDEADRVAKTKINSAFINIIARNRAVNPTGRNKLDFVSTPEGYGFLYNFFKKPDPQKKIIHAKTEDNTKLSPDYIPNLKSQYSNNQLKAYLYGQFVNITQDSVYSSYNREQHRHDEKLIEGEKIYVGMDFNIGNMNAVLFIKREKKMFAFDEITGAFNTQSLCAQLKMKYPNRKIIINPDASGNNRNASGSSNIGILEKEKFTVIAPKKNPLVSERVNAINLAFEQNKLFVDDDACPSFAEALEKQSYDGDAPDKKSGFDHITEAGGYSVHLNLYSNIYRR